MPRGRNRTIGSFYDLIAMVLDRGITIREGGRTVTLALAAKAPAATAQAVRPAAAAAAAAALPAGEKRRPGRPKKVRPQRAAKKAAPKAKPALPDAHAVLVALDGNRATGLKLSALAKQFAVSRFVMKKAIAPLVASGRAELYKPTQTYIPLTKVRASKSGNGPRTTRSTRREKPVSIDAILDVLKSGGGPMDRAAIAGRLGVSYHRLIRRMEALTTNGQVKQAGNSFSLA